MKKKNKAEHSGLSDSPLQEPSVINNINDGRFEKKIVQIV